jgi:hypothetical protein
VKVSLPWNVETVLKTERNNNRPLSKIAPSERTGASDPLGIGYCNGELGA